MTGASRKGRKIDKCSICRKGLHSNFPRDFPDEWKLCCDCYDLAGVIVAYSLERVVEFFAEDRLGIDKYSFIRRAKKIGKLVNLNDCCF